jgi:hypothetical protein
MTYLLVMFIFWTDPALGPTEHRYQTRIAGYYNTLERCEERRKAQTDTKHRLVLYSECRLADG